MLLADVFKKITNKSFNNYGLCPSHYFGVSGLSWDAMSKTTKIELELFPDPDIYIFFEKGTRDRISYITNRQRKANNEYLKSYDSKQESKHIYLDANNFKDYAMSKFFYFFQKVNSNG